LITIRDNNTRSGFYDRHEGPARVLKRELNYASIGRQANNLADTPAYKRTEDDSQDGRDEYAKNLPKYESDFAQVEKGEVRDIYEEAKNDPELRKQLYLRRQMKPQVCRHFYNNIFENFGLSYGKNPSQQPAGTPNIYNYEKERKLQRPPVKTVTIDSHAAYQQYTIERMKKDGNERHEPVPNGPLFNREQHVFLPHGAGFLVHSQK
jgi:hypothetical protein